jgi:hypothetical protein
MKDESEAMDCPTFITRTVYVANVRFVVNASFFIPDQPARLLHTPFRLPARQQLRS